MDLNLLLGQYSKTDAKIKKDHDSISATENRLKRIQESVAAKVSQDFREYVASVNSNLPEDKRVTEWRVYYDGNLGKAFITITELGGKPYYNSDEFTHRDPLPVYLRNLQRFGRKYPVQVYFEMLNHAFLDVPLDEMK